MYSRKIDVIHRTSALGSNPLALQLRIALTPLFQNTRVQCGATWLTVARQVFSEEPGVYRSAQIRSYECSVYELAYRHSFRHAADNGVCSRHHHWIHLGFCCRSLRSRATRSTDYDPGRGQGCFLYDK